MSTKIKKQQPKKKNAEPNRQAMIIIFSLIAALIVLIIAGFTIDAVQKGKFEKGDFTTTQNTNDENAIQNETPNVDNSLLLEVTDTERKNVNVKMSDGQEFTICVYPDVAPQTAQNFLNLVREGFYDGLTFHRIIEDFMAQGGDPEGTGFGGSERNIYGEFAANGYQNTLSHDRGVVSMARSQDFNSASSQFFICYSDRYAMSLDGQYAAFGEVIDGMEVVDSFLSSGTDENDRPLKEVKIAKMTVEE